MALQQAFCNGGSLGLFQRSGAGPWQVQTASAGIGNSGDSLTCVAPQFFPAAVLMAWSLPVVPTPPPGWQCSQLIG
jgi:hypothetical protein